METISEYQKQALEFLENTKTRIFATKKNTASNERGTYYTYDVLLIRDKDTNICNTVPRDDIFYSDCSNISAKSEIHNAKKGYKFEFSGSIYNFENDIKLNAYSILACLSCSAYEIYDFEDWCLEYGYDSDRISHSKIYQACLKEHFSLKKMFSSSELEQLQQIQ